MKYWGKIDGGVNLPATSSLAVTLDTLRTTTTVTTGVDQDHVTVDGFRQPIERFAPMLQAYRNRTNVVEPVDVRSNNSFPTAAGIASSSSGFAAIALGMDAVFETALPRSELSRIARIGSGSACRAVYGGFTTWKAGAEEAEPLLPADHWPELRILVVVMKAGPKHVTSRNGMNHTRATSPYYGSWVDLSPSLFQSACTALADRDIAALGEAMRASYLSMFASMFAARPPLLYWAPESVSLIVACETLRRQGIEVWETMDAGPQVKLLTTAQFSDQVRAAVAEAVPASRTIASAPGGEPSIDDQST